MTLSAAPAARTVSLVIIDDTPDVRLLLRIAFGRHHAFKVVGEAGDGRAGVDLVRELQPDAVLLDLAMPVMDGLRALPLVTAAAPHTVVVVLSGFEGTHMGSAAIAAGAAAYIQKGAPPAEIVDTLASCLGLDASPAGGSLRSNAISAAPDTATRPAPLPHRRRDAPGPDPRAEEDRYRQLVDHGVDHALMFLDAEATIRSWNPGAEHLFGYSAADVVGKHFGLLYPRSDIDSGVPRRLTDEAVASHRATHSRWLTTAAGHQVWGEVVITALRAGTGREAGFTFSVRDHTEQRRLDEAQASLFAMVSHDLRAPLTAIRAFASMIDTVSPDERTMFAERIDANAEQLQRLVTGLFDYAKLRAGALPISVEPLPLSTFATHCVRSLSAMLSDRAVHVADSDVVALADRGALRRVLDNLLSNAVKYSEAGTRISIGITATRDTARLSVSDEGRGIDPADHATIFGEFVRGRLAEDDGGTGLGLASVRELCRMQGGSVWIASQVGIGTTVTVELPRADIEAAAAGPDVGAVHRPRPDVIAGHVTPLRHDGQVGDLG